MALVDLYDQLVRLAGKVRKEIDVIPDGYPLKGWFQTELKVLAPGSRDGAQMEDLSARMRAVRQLEHIVRTHLADDASPGNMLESDYTVNSRLPGNLLHMVKQTNFSIEPKLLLESAEKVELFDLVSPTAKVVGYLRARDGSLSFADALSSPVEARAILNRLGIVDAAVQEKMSLLFRSRYHCINSVVAGHAVPQVLEVASGISPRGLHWSREHPGTVYIESDLPALMREKAKVIRNTILADTVSRRGVLHCCGIDALDLASLEHALEYTDPHAGLVIVTEGVLLYFSADELGQFFANMRIILSARPRAAWVVDFVTRKNLTDLFESDPSVAMAVKSVFASTQREVVASNPFEDDAGIEQMLASHGLKVVSQASLADPPDGKPQNRAEQRARRLICGSRKIWTIVAD